MSNKHKHQQEDNIDAKSNKQNIVSDNEAEIFDNTPEAADEDQTAEDIENAEMNAIQELESKLAEEQAKLEKEKKEYLFLMAEFDNFRKRTIKEKGEIIKNAAESVLKGLLPIVDDFERGLSALQNTDDAEAAKEGMQLIYNKLMKFLEQNGVKPIDSTGQEFNPDLHEAIAMVPTEDESLKGKVIDTPTRGYTINDKVLRYAKVAVGQ
jgi:grpE